MGFAGDTEDMGVFGDFRLPVLSMVKAQHGDAQILHSRGLFLVALLTVREIMWRPIDVDRGVLAFVDEIGSAIQYEPEFIAQGGDSLRAYV